MIAPVLPPNVKKRGIDTRYIGLIIGVHPLINIVTGLYLGKFLGTLGRNRLIIYGCIIQIIGF